MSDFMLSEEFLMEAIVVAIILAASVIVASVISNVISSEKTNSLIELAKEQLQAEHGSLSMEHDKLGIQIANEYGRLAKENAQLKNSLTDIANHMRYLDEQKKVELAIKREVNTRDFDINQTAQQLNQMAMQLDACYIRIEHLESENKKLKQELMHGKNAKRNIDFDYDYDEEEYEELVWEDEDEKER